MPSIYVPLQGTAADLSTLPSTGKKGVIAYTTDTQEIYTDTGSGIGIPAAWKLQTGGGSSGVASLNSLTGALTLESTDSSITITPSGTTINLEMAGSATPNWAINEQVAGGGLSFTLANVPSGGQAALYNGSARIYPGAGNDYTISGATITPNYSIPAGNLWADYPY